jgi:hypothetical protein
VVTVTGQVFVDLSITSSLASLNVFPVNIGGRPSTVGDAFMLYRFTSLVFEYQRSFVSATGSSHDPTVLGYTSVIPTTAPSTRAHVSEMEKVAVSWSSGYPPAKLRLQRRDLLRTPAQWFRRGTGYDDNFEVQGVFYAFTGDPTTMPVLVRYVVEFSDPINIALSRPLPMPRDDEKDDWVRASADPSARKLTRIQK